MLLQIKHRELLLDWFLNEGQRTCSFLRGPLFHAASGRVFWYGGLSLPAQTPALPDTAAGESAERGLSQAATPCVVSGKLTTPR